MQFSIMLKTIFLNMDTLNFSKKAKNQQIF